MWVRQHLRRGSLIVFPLFAVWGMGVPAPQGHSWGVGAGELARGLCRGSAVGAGWARGLWPELTALHARPLVLVEVLILGAVVAA